MECLERGRRVVWKASLPTAIEDADPCEGPGAHRRLVRVPLVALRLVIDVCPEGMPDRFRGPCHARLSEARRTLQTPVPPGLLAPAFCDWGEARLFLACLGGGAAFPLCAEGHEAAGGQDGPGPGQGVQQGEGGMGLGALGNGGVEVGNGVPGHAEWGDKGVHQEGIGGAPASVVSATACLMASMRVVMTSAARTWWARQKRARVVRRARWTACRVGQRRRQSPKSAVSLS
jgi:hypothetical protein